VKYTKNEVVDAIIWTGDNINEIEAFIGSGTYREVAGDRLIVSCTTAGIGDYVVKGTHGRFEASAKEYFADNYTAVPVPDHEDVVHTSRTRREVVEQIANGNAADGNEYWWFFKLSQSWTNGPKMDADTADAYRAKYLPDCTEWSILPGGTTT